MPCCRPVGIEFRLRSCADGLSGTPTATAAAARFPFRVLDVSAPRHQVEMAASFDVGYCATSRFPPVEQLLVWPPAVVSYQAQFISRQLNRELRVSNAPRRLCVCGVCVVGLSDHSFFRFACDVRSVGWRA